MTEIKKLHAELSKFERSLDRYWPRGDYPQSYRDLQYEILEQIERLAARLPIPIEDD